MRTFRTSFARPLFAALALATAAVLPAAQAATINVTCTGSASNCNENLNQIMENANAGDVILVGPGTYQVKATTFVPADQFRIRKGITVRSTGGPSVTTLQGSAANIYAVEFHSMTWNAQTHCPSNAVLEGFTITGSKGGVEIFDYSNLCASPGVVNNVTLRNLIVNPDSTPANTQHGVSLQNVTNSIVDAVTVTDAYANGIYVYKGSNNVLSNNTVQATVTQHAIALSNTTGAIVTGNAVTGSAFHGIIGLGLKNSRIERNTITGQQHDGITITKDLAPPGGFDGVSQNNFIGHNTVDSTVWANDVYADGTGIFLNGNSNGNYVFGNKLSGSPENGIALFGPSFNYVHANRVHRNYQGGILIWNEPGLGQPAGGGVPTNTLVRNNFVYYNPSNAMVNLRDTTGTDIAFNYLSGNNFTGDPAYPATAPGAGGAFSPGPGGVAAQGYPTDSNINIYGNTITGMVNAIYLDTDVLNTALFRNKFFGMVAGGPNSMDLYSNAPATVTWHGGSAMGGNFWQGHAVSGNPSNGSTPFADMFCPGPGACAPQYQDTYPYAAESLGDTPSVTVSLPRTGAQVAANSIKTIAWESKGCSLVDIEVMNGGTLVNTLASNYPDVGYFMWNVPSGQTAGARTIRVTCKNSGGGSLGTGSSGAFTVFSQGITLLSPQTFSKVTSATTAQVTWRRNVGFAGAVDVFINADGIETAGPTGVTGNSATVTIPTTNSNRVFVRITAAAGVNQDSTDGYFSIVRTIGHGITSPVAAQAVPIFSRHKIEWKSYTGSNYVHLEVHNGGGYQFIAQNVADFGNYEWLVPPSLLGSNRNIRITYFSAVGVQVAQVVSNNFNITTNQNVDLSISQSHGPNPGFTAKDVITTLNVANAGPANATGVSVTDTLPAGTTFIWASPGCNHAAGTVTCSVGALNAGAGATLRVIWRPTTATVKTNTATVTSGQSDANAGNNATSSPTVSVSTSAAGTPVFRYRLYSDGTKEHHFTTDLNEYNVLGGSGGWVQEGTVGKVLNNPGSHNAVTAVPYYRLYDNNTFWHHWTTDANEYYTLGFVYAGWNMEGVDGYILPTTAAGTTQLFRLNYPALGALHHWTIDANEYNTLTTSYGWVGEGGSGFVIFP